MGIESLAASVGEDAGTVEDVYEPYLLQNGFLSRTPRGRMATDLAYKHLGLENKGCFLTNFDYNYKKGNRLAMRDASLSKEERTTGGLYYGNKKIRHKC